MQQQPVFQPEKPRKRFSLRRLFRWIVLIVVLLALGFLGAKYGPNLYARLFGGGNTVWISERFSEELKAKNELVVYQTTITGQESVSQEAWLIGEVQKVVVPYSFSVSFVVDLSRASVAVNGGDVEVHLPSPVAGYHKLTVDEQNMKKYDFLYPLTPERYAEIKNMIEEKLYKECAAKQEYLDAAWESAVGNMESLFRSIAERSEKGVTCAIKVVRDDTAATIAPESTAAPAAQ